MVKSVWQSIGGVFTRRFSANSPYSKNAEEIRDHWRMDEKNASGLMDHYCLAMWEKPANNKT